MVYQDYVHNNGLLLRSLRKSFSSVEYCDADDIIGGILDHRVDLFVMPGGADLYYAEKLNGAGNAAIRSYVEKGGSYLGICAGAYYACRRIEWAKDEGAAAIVQDRELGFFPGTASGPLYPLIEDQDFSKSWTGLCRLSLAAERDLLPALYTGGPAFTPDADAEVDVIARYSDIESAPIAIFKTRVGRGRAIFCGPHIETAAEDAVHAFYRHLNPSFTWQQSVAARFRREGEGRGAAVWKIVMDALSTTGEGV